MSSPYMLESSHRSLQLQRTKTCLLPVPTDSERSWSHSPIVQVVWNGRISSQGMPRSPHFNPQSILWTSPHSFLSPLPRIKSHMLVCSGHLSTLFTLPSLSIFQIESQAIPPYALQPSLAMDFSGEGRVSSSPDSQKLFVFPLLPCIQIIELEQKSSLLIKMF